MANRSSRTKLIGICHYHAQNLQMVIAVDLYFANEMGNDHHARDLQKDWVCTSMPPIFIAVTIWDTP